MQLTWDTSKNIHFETIRVSMIVGYCFMVSGFGFQNDLLETATYPAFSSIIIFVNLDL